MPTVGVAVAIVADSRILLIKREDFEVWALPRCGSAGAVVCTDVVRTECDPDNGNETLKTGMQRALMKQAGLTEDDL